MPTFLDCLNEAAAAGEIAPDVAADARQAYDGARAAHAGLGPDEADRAAGRAVMGALEAAELEARRLRALSVRSRRTLLEGVAELKRQRGYTDVQALGGGGSRPPDGGWVQGGAPPASGAGKGGAQMARALELIVENKPGLSGGPFASIDGRYRAVRGQMDAMMADLIEAFETRWGFAGRGRATLENVVREAFGEDTSDTAAKALAHAWGETAEHARKLFNAAGGAIGKLERWGLPQAHDAVKVRRAGKDAWVNFIAPMLDREKMVDKLTSAPFTEARLRAVLGDTWHRIATGGAIDRAPGERLGKGMLARQRAEERFLVFRDAGAWMAYQGQFGDGDPFGAMMGHLDEMARDIGRMQILGPNPDHQFEWLKLAAQRDAQLEEASGVRGAIDRAKSYVRQAENMMDHFTGSLSTPVNSKFSSVGASARSYLTGAYLGSAIISDIPSAPMFGAFARTMAGLSRTGDVGELARLIATPEARRMARRSGFIVEQATDGMVRATQDNLRLMTVGNRTEEGLNAFARRLPAITFRASGLTGWSAARKRAFRFEFMGALHDRRGMTLAKMQAGDSEDAMFADLLRARGFTAGDWDRIRAAEPWEPAEGSAFLRPKEIAAAAGDDLALRVSEMIELETRMAVPETTLWTRAKLVTQQPGTLWGEAQRSWAMFRSFTLTASYLYGEEVFLRGLRRGLTGAGLAAYMSAWAAASLGLLTLAGGISIQLRELAKGRDPRPMDDPKFWGAALMQGGGLGIVGDFFTSAQARNGKSAPIVALGVGGQVAADVTDLTIGNAIEASQGKETHAGREAVKFAGRYAPISSLWWARTAFDRGVIDQLQRMVDPDAEEAFDRQVRRLQKETGQGQWWPEGELLPERAPAPVPS